VKHSFADTVTRLHSVNFYTVRLHPFMNATRAVDTAIPPIRPSRCQNG